MLSGEIADANGEKLHGFQAARNEVSEFTIKPNTFQVVYHQLMKVFSIINTTNCHAVTLI